MSVAAGARVAAVVAGVVRQAVEDAGAAGVVVLDDGSAEARLAAEWCSAALGPERVFRSAPPSAGVVEAVLAAADGAARPIRDASAEVHRLLGRLSALERNALLAHPANKTALLLGVAVPPEPLLPLGDLYASEVERLAGSWSAPSEVVALADAAGGIGPLDAALAELVDRRRPPEAALATLPPAVRTAVLGALERGRFARRRIGLVPKLTSRTLGVDFLA